MNCRRRWTFSRSSGRPQKEEGIESEMHRKLEAATGGVQNAYARYATAMDNFSRAKNEAVEAAKKTEGASADQGSPSL